MQALWQDVRYGLRGIGNRPGFAILAILTLGLGVVGLAASYFPARKAMRVDPMVALREG